jgi:hypothetical protein
MNNPLVTYEGPRWLAAIGQRTIESKFDAISIIEEIKCLAFDQLVLYPKRQKEIVTEAKAACSFVANVLEAQQEGIDISDIPVVDADWFAKAKLVRPK